MGSVARTVKVPGHWPGTPCCYQSLLELPPPCLTSANSPAAPESDRTTFKGRALPLIHGNTFLMAVSARGGAVEISVGSIQVPD